MRRNRNICFIINELQTHGKKHQFNLLQYFWDNTSDTYGAAVEILSDFMFETVFLSREPLKDSSDEDTMRSSGKRVRRAPRRLINEYDGNFIFIQYILDDVVVFYGAARTALTNANAYQPA